MKHCLWPPFAVAADVGRRGAAMANEICQAEFQPLIAAHQEVMKQTQAAMPRGRPTSFEQAKRQCAARLSAALTNAQTSFRRLQQWVTDECRSSAACPSRS
jgi:hypothetical protein